MDGMHYSAAQMRTSSETDLAQVRERLEKTLGEDLPDAVWREVASWVVGLDPSDPGVLDHVGQLLRVHKRGKAEARPRGRPGYQPPGRLLRHGEIRRAEVMTKTYGRIASRFPPIVAFRRRYCPRRSSIGQSVAFLDSPVLRVMSGDALVEQGVPTAHLRCAEVPLAGRTSVTRSAEGVVLLARRYCFDLEWPDGEKRVDVWIPLDHTRSESTETLSWKTSLRETTREIEVLRGSVLDDLRNLAEHLAFETGWPEPLAAWFVVSRQVPASLAMAVDITERRAVEAKRARIVLSVPPWTSPESVKRVYTDAIDWTLGKNQRMITEDSLALFDFVHERRTRNPDRTWPDLFEEWRQKRLGAGRGVEGDWRRFATTYARLEKAILRPLYAMGRSLEAVEQNDRFVRRAQSDKGRGSFQRLWRESQRIAKAMKRVRPLGARTTRP